MKLYCRKWPLSPLLDIGRYTLWLTKGIAFGHKHQCSSIVYYVGWLIISKHTKFHTDFIKRVNDRTWPKTKIWIVKYGGMNYRKGKL